MIVFGQCGYIQAKVVVFVKKLVAFGQKWLYSGKSGCSRERSDVFGQSGCIPDQFVVFLQSGCIRAKLLHL